MQEIELACVYIYEKKKTNEKLKVGGNLTALIFSGNVLAKDVWIGRLGLQFVI